MKRYSYGSILRQRLVMAGLTLGLVTIMLGLFIELAVTSKKSTIDNSVRQLIEPLNPLLDLETVTRLEGYRAITPEVIRAAVRPVDVAGVGAMVPNEEAPASPSASFPAASPNAATQPLPPEEISPDPSALETNSPPDAATENTSFAPNVVLPPTTP